MKIELPRLPSALPEGKNLKNALKSGSVEGSLFKNQFLSAEELEDVELKGCVFQHCRFIGCDLNGFSVWDCSFSNCDFSNCTMENGFFQRSEFLGCKWIGVNGCGSTFKDVYLEDCNGRLWNLSASSVKNVGFNRCDCSSALFRQWVRKDGGALSFHECRLSGCNFFKTELKGVDLSTCSIDGLILSGEELRGTLIAAHQAQDLVGLLGVKIKG